MTKRSFTMLFMLAATIANLLLTVLLIGVLIVIASCILHYGFKAPGEILYLSWMICFIAGLVLDFMLYSRICTWVIERFHLDSKLDSRLMGRRFATGTHAANEAEKPKTVLPKSVLPEEDTWGEEQP